MKNKTITKRAADFGLPYYFDLQAKLGATKHLGGRKATEELLEMCHITPNSVVLNVGCGAGVSSAHIAEKYGCYVFAVDIMPSMVKTAEKWAQKKGVAQQMTFRVADAQELPFDDDQFDIVITESVMTFVPDLDKAASEFVRVTKPGGYVGLCEPVWLQLPPDHVIEVMLELTGQQIRTSNVWSRMLHRAGLAELTVNTYPVTPRSEARDQSGFLRIWDYLRMLGRFVRIYFQEPETRALMKYASFNVTEYFEYMGYGLYVGQKRPFIKKETTDVREALQT